MKNMFSKMLFAINLLIMILMVGVACVKDDQRNTNSIQETPSWATRHVTRIHDDSLSVTCWVYYKSGIDCIPDHELER